MNQTRNKAKILLKKLPLSEREIILRESRQETIKEMLADSHGDATWVALRLQISLPTLYRWKNEGANAD